MPATRQPGMDHDQYDWSPITSRPRLTWPNGAHVALCVVVSLDQFEWAPPSNAYVPDALKLPTGQGLFFPQVSAYSKHEYGNRVGVFNVMEALDRYGIRATAALDSMTAENYPFIVAECMKRQWEFVGHGISVQRIITSEMTEQEEREYIRTSLDAVEKATGQRPVGWFGQEYGESTRTPGLLAEAGIRYLCDWPNDDQPYRMKMPLYSLPVSLELDDLFAMAAPRFMSVMDYGRMLKDAFDTLYRDGENTGRLMVMNLHPYFIGQPFRVKYLEEALEHITAHPKVWKATGEEIIDWFAQNYASSLDSPQPESTYRPLN